MGDRKYDDDEVMKLVAAMDETDHKDGVQRLARVYRTLRDSDPERLRAIEALLEGKGAGAETLGQAAPSAPANVSDILPVFNTEGVYLGTMNRALVAHDPRYAFNSRGNGQEVIVDLHDKSKQDAASGVPGAAPVSGSSGALSGTPAPETYPLYDQDGNRKGTCTAADAMRNHYREIQGKQGEVAAYQEDPPTGWHLRPRKRR